MSQTLFKYLTLKCFFSNVSDTCLTEYDVLMLRMNKMKYLSPVVVVEAAVWLVKKFSAVWCNTYNILH